MKDLKIAKHKFGVQKAGAKARNIDWQLTFEEWYQWWKEHNIDKNIINSKLSGNELCMCRKNDLGAYNLNNIYCASRKQNTIDSRKNKKYITGGEINFKKIKTPVGIFKSRKEAAKYFNVADVTISSWVRKKPLEFSYLD